MKVAVAAFVKTPALSAVKTRLAAAIGRTRAEQFFHLAKAATEALLQQACSQFAAQNIRLYPFWAVAEPAGLDASLWQQSDIPRIHTGAGGLGERMQNVYHQLLNTHEAVLLIGMDSPQNTPANLYQAIACLQQPDRLVFGPAHDGGFYLFGGNQPVPLQHWTAVKYSASDTLAQLTKQLTGYNIHYLPVLSDVDEVTDLAQLCNEMPVTPTPEQQAVIAFCERFRSLPASL